MPPVQFTRHLRTNCAAHQCRGLIGNAIKNLGPAAALGDYSSAVQHVQVLRHVGLRHFDGLEQLTHVLLTIAQLANDAQPDRG